MVVNASNLAKCWDWISSRKPAGVVLDDRSDELAQLALQGPRAQERFAPLVDGDLDPIGYYRHGRFTVLGVPDVLVSRNGYTGEDGFEIYLPGGKAGALWDALLERGAQPIGLGARDTLRMEMCYALYGNELDMETTPLEAGIGWTVKLKKERFVGKDVLVRQKETGSQEEHRRIRGFRAAGGAAWAADPSRRASRWRRDERWSVSEPRQPGDGSRFRASRSDGDRNAARDRRARNDGRSSRRRTAVLQERVSPIAGWGRGEDDSRQLPLYE